jgi:RHH-type rel operon transcriptional repressor/antitoxin RelB
MLYLYSKIVQEFYMLAIRLPDNIEQRLQALAKRTGRTKTYYAREAILTYLEDLEDRYDAEQVLRRIDKGEEATYTLEEVEARHGLAH